jgi:hypothetical protein
MPYTDPEAKKAKDREYYLKNKQKVKDNVKKHRATKEGAALKKVYDKKYRESSVGIEQRGTWVSQNREKVNKYTSNWRKTNPGKANSYTQERRARKLQRTPSWSETADIREYYSDCPGGYHVDHVIPLAGKTVCGLHVLANLQYLTALDNLRKSNKFLKEN